MSIKPANISGDEKSASALELRKLISEFTKKEKALETKLKPFYEQIDLINRQIQVLEGTIPDDLELLKDKIGAMMNELGKDMEIVGKSVAQFDYTPGKTTYSYKNIVKATEALDGFMKAYGEAFNEIVESNKTIGEIRKTLVIRRESFLRERYSVNKFIEGIKNIYKKTINKLNNLFIATKNVENAFSIF